MSPLARHLFRLTLTAVAITGVVLTAGRTTEMMVLGRSDGTARTRIEADVRDSFAAITSTLQIHARPLVDPPAVVAATADDPVAAASLVARAQAEIARWPAALSPAMTVYASDGRPLAWAGRPSDLPKDRLQGDEAWFIAQSTLGLRVVYVTPVVDPRAGRVGTIATQQAVRPITARGVGPDDRFRFDGRFATVSLELAFEDVTGTRTPGRVDLTGPNGRHLVTAVITDADVRQVRERWRATTQSLAALAGGTLVLLLCGPLLDWRRRSPQWRVHLVALGGLGLLLLAARRIWTLAAPLPWSGAEVFMAAPDAPALPAWLDSPWGLTASAFVAAAFTLLLLLTLEDARLGVRRRVLSVSGAARWVAYLGAQVLAGVAVLALLHLDRHLLDTVVEHTSLDLLHFSLHPWNVPLLVTQVGLVLVHGTVVGLAVWVCRLTLSVWRVAPGPIGRLAAVLGWSLPLVCWIAIAGDDTTRSLLVFPLAAVTVLTLIAPRVRGRFRHGSQGFRLAMMAAAFFIPAAAFYPVHVRVVRQAQMGLVEHRLGPLATDQRATIRRLLDQSLHQIDAVPGLTDLVSVPRRPATETIADRAFQLWRVTGLAGYPLTSSVELFGPEGGLVSRFAFNLPDDLNAVPTLRSDGCQWDVFEEVSPFFAEERRVLSATRGVCEQGADGRMHVTGAIEVHAMLDYDNLPFIASRSPYVELVRGAEPGRGEGETGSDVEFAVYGWSRRPLYASSDTAWALDDATFSRVVASRHPTWARLDRHGDPFDVLLLNDRGGIYALGLPVIAPLGHMVNLAELTVLTMLAYLALLALLGTLRRLARRRVDGRTLLREVRASFYRRLFVAFVLATFVPILALAVTTRLYVADQMRAGIDQDAVVTAATAQRVVEDLIAPRATQEGVGIDDNMLVWVSRLIGQDVNLFIGPRLAATSERNLFASGVLPLRMPSDLYLELALRNRGATVSREHIGTLEFLLAGTRMTAPQLDAVLTVPLASRARQIEAQIDTLDRRVLLAVLIFMLAGAGMGYSLAERIADPVSRLTRATRRLSRGDFDVRLAATSSDELGRLVEDFNRMASDLIRQRTELERTHRLEAWAEMARQVAHDIKNPLTPIQLNAEHLKRLNADRGGPLSPVLDQSVELILSQVRLLRQISAEFSSFASAPTVHREAVALAPLLEDLVAPYQVGLREGLRLDLAVAPGLPAVQIDRNLVARALTNLIENGLHALGTTGTVRITAARQALGVVVRVQDTGVGMDRTALERAFEPYFSTKTSGTGLGLPIAKRNVELCGGSIRIASAPGQGTTVELTFPTAVA